MSDNRDTRMLKPYITLTRAADGEKDRLAVNAITDWGPSCKMPGTCVSVASDAGAPPRVYQESPEEIDRLIEQAFGLRP